MSRLMVEKSAVFNHLVNELMQECISENVTVSLDFCAYLVDLKLIQLSKTVSRVVDDRNVAEPLIENCVSDLKKGSLWVKTLKLQVFWRDKYQSKDEIRKYHHETVFKNILPLMTEISEGSLIKTVDKEDFYRKIVIFIIMFAGLGSPTQQSIITETQAALHSIFKITEIDNFLCLSKPTKEQQLIEFARLVTGIRLFNKDCKKGGEGIDDLPLILTQGVRATKERLVNYRSKLDKRIHHIIKALSQIYNLRQCDEEESDDELSIPSGFKREEVEELKSLLVYCRQLELCMKYLIRDLEDSIISIEELVGRLQSTLLKIHDIVKYRVAIATVQVFPLFLNLTNVWVEMQEEVDILSEINNEFENLSAVANLPPATSLESTLCTSIETAPLSDVKIGDEECYEFYPGVKFCKFSTISDQKSLQYEGFCAWSLAQLEGLLLTGNVDIGVVCFENCFYCFSSANVAYKWAKNPRRYIKKVLNVARTKLELIKLLNLYNELEAIVEEETALQEETKPTKENVQVQTELHPIDSYVSRDYTFSEWELKRRAIKLAALTDCKTKSQQTIKRSMFRTDVGIQVTSDKKKGTQIKRDVQPVSVQNSTKSNRNSFDTVKLSNNLGKETPADSNSKTSSS